jgi:Ca2+-binding RTX toxin-like protein
LAVLALVGIGAAPAFASYTATPVPDVYQDGRPPVPGILMTGDAASDNLTITVNSDVLEHDRFGVDPGFASAQDFDSATAGTQTIPSTYASRIMVDAGAGQDSLKLVDARPDNETNWLHAGPGTACVQEQVGGAVAIPLCYRPATVESMTLDGGPGNDNISSLDAFATTPLTLMGGDGNDSLSQDGPDGVHGPISSATLIGGPGRDEAALTEDQTGSVNYTVGGGQIQGEGYGPLIYDDTDEFLTLYTRLGPSSNVKITDTGPRSITVWSAGGTVDSRQAGPGVDVLVRTSLFELDDQGAIFFHGGPGNDVFSGTESNDKASGGGGNDQLDGNGGKDRLSGDAGPDLISGGAGSDRIGARDGERDSIDCGPSRDRAKVDKHEASLRGCEVVKKPH